MSVQVFLQGKITGIEEFLTAPEGGGEGSTPPSDLSLLTEVLPRALLAELGLARLLLGSSGGGQFLVVLPQEMLPQAEEFMNAAAGHIDRLSAGRLRLVSAATENLGDWSVVRRRLADALQPKLGTPAAGIGPDYVLGFQPEPDPAVRNYFNERLALELPGAAAVGWSPEQPAMILLDGGKHAWPLTGGPATPEAISIARHTAASEDGHQPATLAELAERAQGRRTFGVLRGDVDDLGIRLRRIQSIEEHVQLSVMYKQFFAGELEVVCSLPEFWRKATVLYSGGDDFAVFGSWDALIPLARELQRLFHRFCEENLKEFPGPEGKTITMAIALAHSPDQSLATVFEEAGRLLALAKSSDKDCIHVLGQTLEWRQLAAASDLRETILRMAGELNHPRRFLADLDAFFRKAAASGSLSGARGWRLEKPWQVQRHLSRALGETREKELQKLKNHLTNEILAKSSNQVRVRPGGRLALEWARLLAEV
jgi:CRISPR-associated protein Csm1